MSAAAGGELAYATVAQLQGWLRTRQVSALEIVEALLARIAQYEPSLHAFVTATPDVARDRARAADARFARGDALGPMDGVPYGLKDVINAAGIRTTGQSRILEHNVPASDAFVEARLKGAGGVLLGKMTTYEFAHGGPSWDLPWPPAMNPWKKGYLPGSTSSGPGAVGPPGTIRGNECHCPCDIIPERPRHAISPGALLVREFVAQIDRLHRSHP